MIADERRWRMYGPKLVVVPDPMILSPRDRVLGLPTALSVSAQIDTALAKIDTMVQQLQTGMITMQEARDKMMGR